MDDQDFQVAIIERLTRIEERLTRIEERFAAHIEEERRTERRWTWIAGIIVTALLAFLQLKHR